MRGEDGSNTVPNLFLINANDSVDEASNNHSKDA